MRKIFDKLFFSGPMSLGDSFVASGVVHHFGDRCQELHLPVLPKFHKTLSTLYQDHPHIKVVGLMPYAGGEDQYVQQHGLSRILRSEVLTTTIKGLDISPMWDIQIYSNFELSYGLRYSNFRLPKHIAGANELYINLAGMKHDPYILWHRFSNDFPNGAPIDLAEFRRAHNMPEIRIIEIVEGITDNMMQYTTLIKHATEIHCIPSSFHCLVDSIQTDAKLFFHDIREKTSMAVNSEWNNRKWVEVKYNPRM